MAVEITVVVKAKENAQDSVVLTLEGLPLGDDPTKYAAAVRDYGARLIGEAAAKLDRLYGKPPQPST